MSENDEILDYLRRIDTRLILMEGTIATLAKDLKKNQSQPPATTEPKSPRTNQGRLEQKDTGTAGSGELVGDVHPAPLQHEAGRTTRGVTIAENRTEGDVESNR